MKVREVVRVLEKNGFRFARQRGSHRRYKGTVDGKVQLVTVAGKDSDELTRATLASIRRQSGLPRKSFRKDQA